MPHDARPADVVAMGPSIDFPAMLDDLAARGVGRLMVEGGGAIHTAFLAQGLADEIHLAIAPLLVGQPGAPRFLHSAAFPGAPGRRLRLLEARTVEDMVLIRYAVPEDTRPSSGPGDEEFSAPGPGPRGAPEEDRPGVFGADLRWLRMAVELARLCPPSRTAFSVGAIIVDAAGDEISRGHSRESDPHVHAEEAALAKLPEGDPRLAGSTIYTSLEPCCRRRSRPRTCTELILAAGIRRVVLAWREPDTFVADCQGAELLSGAGAEVIEIPSLAEAARSPNAHLNL
jgi:pyrimidine deaminase RibD-like protein